MADDEQIDKKIKIQTDTASDDEGEENEEVKPKFLNLAEFPELSPARTPTEPGIVFRGLQEAYDEWSQKPQQRFHHGEHFRSIQAQHHNYDYEIHVNVIPRIILDGKYWEKKGSFWRTELIKV